MSDQIKKIAVINRRYFFFDGKINIKHFDAANKIKIDKKSH